MTDPDKPADYKPIACAAYDLYEIAIMSRQPLHLTWKDDNIFYDMAVTPVNLETRAGEEFLIARTTGDETIKIRLDRITKAIAL
jgi:transcriptional antiterminator Rof (Rho-off)